MFDSEIYSGLRQFDCMVAGEAMDVYEIKIAEGVFSEFEATVTLVCEQRVKIRDYVGKDALLTLIGKKDDRFIHGMIRSMEEVEERGRFHLYKIVVVPYVWKLSQIRDVRIFQEKTVPDIIKEVLEGSGILSTQFEFRTEATYAPREYCVQYRETNLAFIKRLMAEEGMFHYHEFSDAGHLLVIGDSFICHKTIPGSDPKVLFSPKGQLVNEYEYITRFDLSDGMTSGRVQLVDYHFQTPSFTPQAITQSDLYNDLERYDYPGYLDDDNTGTRLATIHLERHTCKRLTMAGNSVCRRLTPGHRFTLTDHYNEDVNIEYTVLSLTHTGKQPQALQELADQSEGNTYENTMACIPSEVSFHPDAWPKPSVTGVQTAVVTGPESEEIFTDEYGRIKVQFHWDRLEPPTDKTSCWMRVAQSWAGSGWGSIFIPRIGQEVIVSFIDGDPDRPIVTGAVYNGRNMPPYALPADKTKSTIKTNSTIGGGGFNEIRFEDKKGEEEIYIHGEKDWNIEILNDKGQKIGHDEKLDVVNDRTKSVGNDQKESIGNNKDITVAKTHTEDIGEDMRVTVARNKSQKIGENKGVEIGKNLDERVGENVSIRIGNTESVEIGKDYSMSIGNNASLDVKTDAQGRVGSNTTVSSGKHMSADAGETITVSAGKTMTLSSGGADVVIKTGGATITLAKNGDITLDGANITINASGNINMKGSAINQN